MAETLQPSTSTGKEPAEAYLLLIPLKKTFSDSARKASAEARRAKAQSKLSAGGAGPQGGSHGGGKVGPGMGKPQEGKSVGDQTDTGGATPTHADLGPEKASPPASTATKMSHAKVTENTPTSTKIDKPVEVTGRTKPPDSSGVHLSTRDKPVDYGEVNDLLKEKYGPVRGEKSYQALIDNPGQGVHFVIGNKIVAEKKAMMNALGKVGDHRNHNYQGLYRLHSEKNAEESGKLSPAEEKAKKAYVKARMW